MLAKKSRVIWLAGAICAVLLAVDGTPQPAHAGQSCDTGTQVAVGTGSICGTTTLASAGGLQNSIAQYQGIQYATAGRWASPVLQNVTTSITATSAGSICPQPGANNQVVGAEQCLFLNISTPLSSLSANASKLPVIFFIHGGAFLVGGGSLPLYDGSTLAGNQNVVVVTINYRWGALGLLANNNYTNLNGNFALMDQQAALAWVQTYIAAFGGDPTRVTIVGESAGAESVGLQLFSVGTNPFLSGTPDNRTTFSSAIMESNPMAVNYPTVQQATQIIGEKFMGSVCSSAAQPIECGTAILTHNLSWFQNQNNLTAQQIITAQKTALEKWGAGVALLGDSALNLPFLPVMDGVVVLGQPNAGYATNLPPAPNATHPQYLPYVFGLNQNEGSLFAQMVFSDYATNKSNFDATALNTLLTNAFSATVATKIQNQTPYIPTSQADQYSYWSSTSGDYSAAALGNILTDYLFNCGNFNAANTVSSQTAGKGVPLYGYQFQQPASFNLYYPSTTQNACQPDANYLQPVTGTFSASKTPNICHANELPYVFGTLTSAGTGGNGTPISTPPSSADIALSATMNAAWAAFAYAPTNPGAPWVPYTPTTSAVAIFANTGSPPSPSTVNINTTSNCTSFWSSISPAAGLVHMPKRTFSRF